MTEIGIERALLNQLLVSSAQAIGELLDVGDENLSQVLTGSIIRQRAWELGIKELADAIERLSDALKDGDIGLIVPAKPSA